MRRHGVPVHVLLLWKQQTERRSAVSKQRRVFECAKNILKYSSSMVEGITMARKEQDTEYTLTS